MKVIYFSSCLSDSVFENSTLFLIMIFVFCSQLHKNSLHSQGAQSAMTEYNAQSAMTEYK